MPFPTPRDFKNRIPLSPSHKEFIQTSRHTIERILNRTDTRIAIIAGPCSIHNIKSALEYARRFKKLASEVADAFYLVMRVYVEKPRTAPDWKGFLYDPDLVGTDDVEKGIALTRELMAAITDIGVPIATEFLDPMTAPFFAEFASWGFIGARTSASQPHRQLGSLLQMPIGFKNGVDGNVEQAIFAVESARLPQKILSVGDDGRLSAIHTQGNPLSHVVLRGGIAGPNYDADSVRSALSKLTLLGIDSPLIIDCSHGNSERDFRKQKDVFRDVMEQIEAGNNAIAGVMLESHLEEGNQFATSGFAPSVSITDPCLDWASTEELVLSSSSRLMSLTQS